MRSKRTLVLPSIAAAALLALSACTSSAEPAATAGSDSDARTEVRVALAEVTSNLDPALYNVPANYMLISGAAGYLVSYPFQKFPYTDLWDGDAEVFDADNFDPELATDWELSDDGLSLTMHLREDAESPYGNTLTADDVVWTAQRNVALKTVGEFGMTVANINKEDPVTAVDDHTVVWNLTEPTPLLLKVLAWSWFAPIDSVEAQAHATADDPWAQEWLKENTAFYGPYTVTEFTPGQNGTMELNPGWFGDTPAIEKITFQSVPDAGNRQQLVQRGEVDFVPDIPRSQLTALQGKADVQVLLQPGIRFSYLQYRAGIEPLDNQLVREAISYAIPYEQILEDVYYGTSLPAKTPSTWLPNAFPELSPYEYDLDKAQELLAEAGYGDGFTVSLTYSTANPGPENEQVAILIADSLKDIGVTVNLQKPSSEAAFTTSYNAGEFEMALAGLSPGAPDAGYALFVMGNTAGFQNMGDFSNAEFDALSDEMLSDMDPDSRAKLIEQATELYMQLVPATPIANPLVGMVTNPDLTGIKLGPWNTPFWKYASFK